MHCVGFAMYNQLVHCVDFAMYNQLMPCIDFAKYNQLMNYVDFAAGGRVQEHGPNHVLACVLLHIVKPAMRYLAHKKTPAFLGTPWDPGHRPTVGS